MNDESSETPKGPQHWLLGALRDTVSKAGEAARDGAEISGRLAHKAAEAAQATIGKMQLSLGEDYYAILERNPMVLDTLSRSDLLEANSALLSTAFNVPWTSTLLWSAASAGALTMQRPIAQALGEMLHYGPGHIQRWDEINAYMDTAVGVGHRLKFGHSIEHLPQVVEKFGMEGVPAFFMHLLQDFTTIDGIPVVPGAWDVKDVLQWANVPRKLATGLVSVSFSSTLAALCVMQLVSHLWESGSSLLRKRKTQSYLKTAAEAIHNRDYQAAVANYQRALEVERNPYVLMALGQVYMQRAAHRLRAHLTFTDAMTLLATSPDATVPYHHAALSARGLAGIQALATADVLGDIHPEHWNDHVRDLVNATVSSFTAAASRQARQSDNLVLNTTATPPHFSAAINYYLAAKSACYCPFADERHARVLQNTQAAVRSVGLMAQYDEERLRPPANTLRQLWARELLPPGEMETALAGH